MASRRRTLMLVALLSSAAALSPGAMVTSRAEQFPGGGVPQTREVLRQFDKDGNGRLSAEERRDARAFLETQPARGFGRGGRGGTTAGPAQPSPKFDATRAQTFPASVSFYDPGTLRTLIFEFENDDWDEEVVAFNDTDIEVPATLRVDGQTYRDVGVRTRGMSSFMMVPKDRKLSLNVTVDWVHGKQDVQGYQTLNLLNANGDPTYLRPVFYLEAAREYIPSPSANYVRVVANGENRGIYINVEQVNKSFLERWYKVEGGSRWKVPGSPNGRGGLEYLGDDVAAYRRIYDIRTKDDPKAWAALIALTKVLNQTPPDRLEAALKPILDVDETLEFLALEVVFVNSDGYWTRASDYDIYLDPAGRFHTLPHDVNEAFPGGEGRGFGPPPGEGFGPPPGGGFGPPPGGGFGRGGRGGRMMEGDATLDPLVGLDDASKPLRSKLLAVPALRSRYLGYVRAIATKWLDWNRLGPLAAKYQALIAADVKADTRKLYSVEAFESGVQDLRAFVERRRAVLLGETPSR
ncbi:MAG: CotH kinase family protein [Acidobacteria bacterium]|nr:CotH kinase family protein [Acidobacteriota bacterium]